MFVPFTIMIKIYEYYGLEVYFENDKQLPIRVFAKRDKAISFKIIRFKEGLLDTIRDKQTNHPLDEHDQALFNNIFDTNISVIIKNWIDYFVYERKLQTEIITKKIELADLQNFGKTSK